MGLLNVNFIGAYIVTLFVVGILLKCPDVSLFEQRARGTPLIVRVGLAIILVLVLAERCKLLGEGGTLLAPIRILTMLLSGLTLWVHEAGHVYFSWDGEVLHSLGGTLNQLLFPMLVIIFGWLKRYPVTLSLGMFWLGLSFVDVGIYMADAQAQELSLLGGGTHDWKVVFGAWGLLEYDAVLGRAARTLGGVTGICGSALLVISRCARVKSFLGIYEK